MKQSKVNQIFQGIVGVLFIGFGLLYLLMNTITLDIAGWALGGVVAVFALIRLIIVCLPSTTSFPGSAPLEITAGICDALFGVFFVVNAIAYVEFFYPLMAGLFVIMAAVRFAQSGRIKKSGNKGMGSFVFMGVILLFAAAGLMVITYIYRIELQLELIGSAALLYGFFMVGSASFKRSIMPVNDMPADEGAQPEVVSETATQE